MSVNILSGWACELVNKYSCLGESSMLPECWFRMDWKSALSVHNLIPCWFGRVSISKSSPTPIQLLDECMHRSLWGWCHMTWMTGGGMQQTQPHGMLSLHRAWSCLGAARVWTHSTAVGLSHVSATKSKKLWCVYAMLQKSVACPGFRQMPKNTSLTQNHFH